MPAALFETEQPTRQDCQKAAEAVESMSSGQLDLSQLPDGALQLLTRVLEEIADGRALSLVRIESDMTTNEAADYLNVSRPYLIKLLDEKKIPFHHVGSHKRVSYEDIKRYKQEQRKRSYAAMEELQAQAQELNLGY